MGPASWNPGGGNRGPDGDRGEQRVSGTLDPSLIRDYYSHPGLQYLAPFAFPVMVAVIVFGYGLRVATASGERGRFFGGLGLAMFVAETPLLIAQMAAQATLVTITQAGGDPLPLFRFWDVLYNSGTYAVEATAIACFSLAVRDMAAFPKWLPRFGIVVAGLQVINMMAIFVGIPDTATSIGNVAFMVWIGTNARAMGRLAGVPLTTAEPPLAISVT